jgi:uncharacterized membrane protein
MPSFLASLLLLPVLDMPWLWYQSTASQSMFRAIQRGRDLEFKLWPAVIVYMALAYLLTLQTSVKGAFMSGSAVYAVYDFTNLVTFKDYELSFAIQDTLWGGVLFAVAFWLLS